jgi:hypothetical protein
MMRLKENMREDLQYVDFGTENRVLKWLKALKWNTIDAAIGAVKEKAYFDKLDRISNSPERQQEICRQRNITINDRLKELGVHSTFAIYSDHAADKKLSELAGEWELKYDSSRWWDSRYTLTATLGDGEDSPWLCVWAPTAAIAKAEAIIRLLRRAKEVQNVDTSSERAE